MTQWSKLSTSNPNIKLMRLKTPQGWLVRTNSGESLLHLKDANNDWIENSQLTWTRIPNAGAGYWLFKSRIPSGWILYKSTEKFKEESLLYVDDSEGIWQT